MDDQNKNLILATALSLLVILAYYFLFPPEQPPVEAVPEAGQSADTGGLAPADDLAAVPPVVGESDRGSPGLGSPGMEATLSTSDRLSIETPSLVGSVSLGGGRIDDLSLTKYRETLDEDSEIVRLLSPAGTPLAYYALFGWIPGSTLGYGDVPGANTPWQVESGTILTPESPVTLVWRSEAGLIFRRTMSIDENYLFSISQNVVNESDTTVRLAPYGVIARHGEPDTQGFFILHEGVVQMSDGELNEIDYSDVPDLSYDSRESANLEMTGVKQNGWIGFTDKYWMMTLIPEPGSSFTAVSKYSERSDIYQTEARLPAVEVHPGGSVSIDSRLFSGAKEWEAIRSYENDLGIERFIDSIDWGWFFFLTKPIFMLLHWINGQVGNMGWAIIGLTFVIKAFLFPLAYKSYVSMARMKELQPEMEKIKQRVGDDKKRMQAEMMQMYKSRKINPAAGCLPILPQIPIFFSLYKVIFVTIELRHAPFILWIRDLSAPDPTSILNLFGALPWGTPDPGTIFALVSLGVLPILLGITMWMQQKLNPAPTDPTQAMIFAWMPWIFMFMLGQFASGLIIYWIANNTITFVQQYAIMRSQGVKPDILGNIIQGFKRRAAGQAKSQAPPAPEPKERPPAPKAKKKRKRSKK